VVTALGLHLLIELRNCNADLLDSSSFIEDIMVEAAEKSGATILHSSFHKFCPQGVSGVVVIAESHLTIHTWPELNYAALDVFTCGTHVDPWKAALHVEEKLQARDATITDIRRGIPH
jgi:S-adenosylmethionine decarboxylase